VWWGGLGAERRRPPRSGRSSHSRSATNRDEECGGGVWGRSGAAPPRSGRSAHFRSAQQGRGVRGGSGGGAAPLPPRSGSERTLSIGHNRTRVRVGGLGESGPLPPRSGRSAHSRSATTGTRSGGGGLGEGAAPLPPRSGQRPSEARARPRRYVARAISTSTRIASGQARHRTHLVLVSRGRGCRLLHHPAKSLKVRPSRRMGASPSTWAAGRSAFEGRAELVEDGAISRDPPSRLATASTGSSSLSGWGAISARASRRERASSSVSAHHALVAGA